MALIMGLFFMFSSENDYEPDIIKRFPILYLNRNPLNYAVIFMFLCFYFFRVVSGGCRYELTPPRNSETPKIDPKTPRMPKFKNRHKIGPKSALNRP